MKNFVDPSATVKRKARFEAPVSIGERAIIGHAVEIGRYSYVNSHSTVGAGTRIGRFCAIARHVEIGAIGHPTNYLSIHPFQYHTRHFAKSPGYKDIVRVDFDERHAPEIGHDVWIGTRATILRGIRIGNGAIIAAGAVVTRDVAPYSIVGGMAAKEIRKRFPDEIIARLQAVEWWNRDMTELSGLPFDDIEAALERLEAMG